ncbi:MAG: N-acetylmuramoyl-L-alanine amidase [Ruminococcaceae bacterium]|nr:N-acetylmuramoyl-L-alanine amidase [Oscillospiraceae bacterium]
MAIKIFIDQGHNPTNPNAGAEGNGLREQDLTYEIGIILAQLLSENGNYEVLVSRPTPETQLGTTNAQSLAARVNAANSWGADYFISLHANASSITSASGSEGYVYSLGGAAQQFAENILTGLSDVTGLPNRGVFARPTLYVLRRTAMPAALIELGFITNPGDAALMSEDPQLFALGVYNGINRYFGLA